MDIVNLVLSLKEIAFEAKKKKKDAYGFLNLWLKKESQQKETRSDSGVSWEGTRLCSRRRCHIKAVLCLCCLFISLQALWNFLLPTKSLY